MSAICTEVTNCTEYDNVVMFYNEFKSVVAYETTYQVLPVLNYDATAEAIEEVLIYN